MINLSKKEIEVTKFIAEGRSNEYIANKLYRSKTTIRSHLMSIYKKLDIKGDQFNKRLKLALLGQELKGGL